MRFLGLIFTGFMLCVATPSMGASELSKINAQIKQTEQQNKKLEQQVKTSEREISQTKKKLVKAADKVSNLEDQRSAMMKKIAELDQQRDKIAKDMEKNRERIADATASILFVASHPSFDTDDMREFVLTSAVLSGTADKLQEDIDQATKQIAELENNGKLTLDLNGTPVEIEAGEVEIFSEDIPGWVVTNEGTLTVALDTVVTDELRREGIARELVSKIQNIRKSSGFEITDKIRVVLSRNEHTDAAINEYNDYICNQVLANSLDLANINEGTELEFDDFTLWINVMKE